MTSFLNLKLEIAPSAIVQGDVLRYERALVYRWGCELECLRFMTSAVAKLGSGLTCFDRSVQRRAGVSTGLHGIQIYRRHLPDLLIDLSRPGGPGEKALPVKPSSASCSRNTWEYFGSRTNFGTESCVEISFVIKSSLGGCLHLT
jgi:hypothetical protein